MDELIAFLNARITDDERIAAAASNAPWQIQTDGDWSILRDADGDRIVSSYDDADFLPADADHIARHDPARVLADIAAKRAIVRMAENAQYAVNAGSLSSWNRGQDSGALSVLTDAIRLLAMPYANHPDFHPDFKPEWAPR